MVSGLTVSATHSWELHSMMEGLVRSLHVTLGQRGSEWPRSLTRPEQACHSPQTVSAGPPGSPSSGTCYAAQAWLR